MRILQIGFGPLSAPSLSLADRHQARLTILDPDRRRLERARMAFADRGDLDFIEKVEELGVAGFDVVIAASALYRYRHIVGFWAGLRRAMAPGAILAAIEPPPSFFRDLTLGLDACFTEDAANRTDGLSVSEADWLETMQAIGLSDAQGDDDRDRGRSGAHPDRRRGGRSTTADRRRHGDHRR